MARILIADDEESVRFALAKALGEGRHKIHQARDGNEALKSIAKQTVDLAIIDIIMPNRDGLETIREIRMNWPDVKIIAMSGGGRIRSPDFLTVAARFGASAILKKPFSLRELRHAVSTMLDQKGREPPMALPVQNSGHGGLVNR